MNIAMAMISIAAAMLLPAITAADDKSSLMLHERSRGWPAGTNVKIRTVEIDPAKTAVIVTDMWDKHWCESATARVAELAPAINEFVNAARAKGMFVIHAPSETMEFYQDHPSRLKAINAARAPDLPDNINSRCVFAGRKLLLQRGVYDMDGGCDKPCVEKPCWQHKTWTRQIASIEIRDGDAISDSGAEIWNLMYERGIENVILVGVHTNMCIINRQFGLCNMKRQGKHAILVRDLTDSMYNPEKPPRVDHFTGTDRVVEYIERYLAPTILSNDISGKPPFRFKEDRREGER